MYNHPQLFQRFFVYNVKQKLTTGGNDPSCGN